MENRKVSNQSKSGLKLKKIGGELRKKRKYTPQKQHQFLIKNDNEDIMIIGERSMWRAVIAQSFIDAVSVSDSRRSAIEKARAIAWLSSKSTDFFDVCMMADLDPQDVYDEAAKIIANSRNTNFKGKYMAFRKNKGRPSNKTDDIVTKELREKHQSGYTMEMIDILHQKDIITKRQLSAAVILRSLFKNRFGSPNIQSYVPEFLQDHCNEILEDPQKELIYLAIIAKLKNFGFLEQVMNIVIFNKIPIFFMQKGKDFSDDIISIRNGLDIVADFYNIKKDIA